MLLMLLRVYGWVYCDDLHNIQDYQIDIDMPKLIDNYVLSRKIGAGQYG